MGVAETAEKIIIRFEVYFFSPLSAKRNKKNTSVPFVSRMTLAKAGGMGGGKLYQSKKCGLWYFQAVFGEMLVEFHGIAAVKTGLAKVAFRILYSGGLQQAVEAQVGKAVQAENVTNLFYGFLGG